LGSLASGSVALTIPPGPAQGFQSIGSTPEIERLACPKTPTRPNSATATLAQALDSFRQLFPSRFAKTDRKSPVRVHVLVIRLADLKAKPVASHENAHPFNAWSCQLCNQHCAPSPFADLVQIQHHQDKSLADGRHRLACAWPRMSHPGLPSFKCSGAMMPDLQYSAKLA
jgi:hypothetical protein